MRFVWAVAAFVLAAVMIGGGIAQRTVFQGPKTETATISAEQAPYILIDGAVLNKLPGSQTLRAEGDGTIFASYGRTADMKAWLADSAYEAVTLGTDGQVVTTDTEPEAAPAASSSPSPSASPTDSSQTTTATAQRSPVGSDLWLDEFQQDGVLIAPLQLPDTMSVLVATDGTAPAPSQVSVSWAVGNATPWAGPLILGGGILMVVGVILYILGIRHVRRSRGPRRKGLPMPVTEPIDLAVEGADKGVISAGTRQRALTRRRAFTVVPVVAVSALLLSGCSADSWPDFAGSPTPSPTQSVIVPEGQKPPAVTTAQADRILTRIAQTVADADGKRDETLASSRLDGAVLAERATNYKLRGGIPDFASLAAIPTSSLRIVLPQAVDGWPRTVMAVVDDAADKTASIMLLTQKDAWSPYKLSYLSTLEAATQMPDLAAEYVGASQVPPDSSFLVMAPEELAAAYADVLNKGADSAYASQFVAEGDQFRASIAADRQKRLDSFNQTAASTGSLTFESTAGSQAPLALATLESGAIVAVNVNEIDTVKPTNADAVIKANNNAMVKTLAGAEQSSTGFTTTYSDQLFFYVPGQGSTEKIRLLGYSSNPLDAKVIP
ncbi:glycosyl transferase [Microbacterium rhizomatis]|uniref:Glycosyl transferase n=1 Tax=Microbacterium rhizomatis TaxID=1631477 RepID=A0A5J5J3P8_9MICO|nr:glycosyl transferase [Microbacterium rhizomatis]KAA9110696.1 glycosyl transferase [Microbacterium rhizomatis]